VINVGFNAAKSEIKIKIQKSKDQDKPDDEQEA